MNHVGNQSKSAAHDIKVKHDGPERKMFVGEDVGLLVHGIIAEVVDHEILSPKLTSLAEGDGEFTELPDSMKGVIYGKGEVQRSHYEAFITLGEVEHIFIPHGRFDELSPTEAAAHEPATWKFSFEYSVKPCCGSGKSGDSRVP